MTVNATTIGEALPASIPVEVKALLVTTLAFSLVAGTYVEHKMIEFLKSPATNKTDIDALILFEQLVNLINAPIILLQLVRILVPLRLTNGYPVAVQMLGLAMEAAVVLSIGHRAWGSFVIAGVRVLYIKFHHILIEVGVNRFVTVAKWAIFSFVLTVTLGHVVETYYFRNPSTMVFYAFCTDLAMELEDFESVFDHICALTSLFANVTEFLFFLIIISELVRHNRSAATSSGRDVGRKRAHKNVVTGAGHFISWLIEFLLFFICHSIVTAQKDSLGATHWIYFMLWPSINYVVFPTVQTLTSDNLRRHTFGRMYSSCCRRKTVAPQAVEIGLIEANPNNNTPLSSNTPIF